MDQSERDNISHRNDGSPPSLAIQQRALAALKGHPHYLAAASNGWCVPKFKLVPTYLIERTQWDEAEKSTAKERLKGFDNFLLVSYLTAATAQDAISGSGTIYDFALHPETMEVLHTSKSLWTV